MGFSAGSGFADVVNDAYVAGQVTVGTTEVIAKSSTNNLAGRQELLIYNLETNDTIYFGPSGVTTSTGIPIQPGEVANFPFGDEINLYLIADTAGNVVQVQEVA